MGDLQKRFQQRRAEILENPEPVENAQWVTPRSVAIGRAEARRLLQEQQAARESSGDSEKSNS